MTETNRHRRTTLRGMLAAMVGLCAGLSAGAAPAQVETPGGGGRPSPADRRAFREAVRRGEVYPLRRVAQRLREEVPGEVLDVRYRRVRGLHLFAFRVLGPDGRLAWYVVDAATLEVMTRAEARARFLGE